MVPDAAKIINLVKYTNDLQMHGMKTALIAGSSGLVGSELLRLLESTPIYAKIHVIVRKRIDSESPKVVQHLIDFDKLHAFNPGEPVDHIFCTLGTTIKKAGTKENFRKVDYDYVHALGEKAIEWKAEKFMLVSALGANPKSRIFYNRVKGEIEIALGRLDFPHLFVFRPSLLLGDRTEHRSGEKAAINLYKVINPLFVGKLKKYKGIQAGQVARALLLAALKNEEKMKVFESDEMQDL